MRNRDGKIRTALEDPLDSDEQNEVINEIKAKAIKLLDVPGHIPVYCTGELTATRSPPPLAKEHNQSINQASNLVVSTLVN